MVTLYAKSALLITLVFTGVSAARESADYIGLHESEIRKMFGKPEKILRDKAEGAIFVYSHIFVKDEDFPILAPIASPSAVEGIRIERTLTTNELRQRGFYINKKGFVYRVGWEKRSKSIPPTFGEQMREIVQARDRGEITYDELMVLRDTLSKQYAGGPTGSSQADKALRKFLIRIKKPVAEIPISTPEADHPSYPATTPPDEEPTSVMPAGATPTSRKPDFNCSGIRKFMLRCLRRPYPFETND